IELDGYTHGFEEVVERDQVKEQRLNNIGIIVLRFSDDDVMNNIEGGLAKIEEHIRTHPFIPS
ncbi:MAG: DUF559 domain-containing protein, partial [Nitrospinae bacterium]|nr:DUF559 domain-containing protein [Nitrospinota bacterium]